MKVASVRTDIIEESFQNLLENVFIQPISNIIVKIFRSCGSERSSYIEFHIYIKVSKPISVKLLPEIQ